MRFVFISFYEAYPPVNGAASVSWNLAKHCGGEKIFIQVGHKVSGIRMQDDVRIITLQRYSKNRFNKLLQIPSWIFRMVGHIRRINPDIIILEGASWVLYHWLLIKATRFLAKPVKLIYHSHNVERILRKDKHNRLILIITRWAEKRILHEVDIATAVSSIDQHQFEIFYGVKTVILPNGVDIDSFNSVSASDIDTIKKEHALTSQTILFMGSYFYKPNMEAINFLIQKVMPKVIRRHPNARLAIIGGDVPYKKSWLINPGCVPSQKVPVFVKSCAIGVAPIFSGSGTRLKILEYMAAGRPVVATLKGTEGLNCKNGKHILIANNEIEFSETICKLLTKKGFSKSVGESGLLFVCRHFSWKTIMKIFPVLMPTPGQLSHRIYLNLTEK